MENQGGQFDIDVDVDIPDEIPELDDMEEDAPDQGSADEQCDDEPDRRPVCHFFAKGNCKKGNACGFRHAADSLKTRNPSRRVYKGTEVAFGPGAEVTGVELLQEKLPYTGQVGDGLGLSTEKMPDEAVIVAWYKPTKSAVIYYALNKRADARWAERRLRGKLVKGKKIKVRYIDWKFEPPRPFQNREKRVKKPPKRNAVYISHLDRTTTKADIDRILGPKHKYAAMQVEKRPNDDFRDSTADVIGEMKMALPRILSRYIRMRRLDDDPVGYEPLPDTDPLMWRMAVRCADAEDAQRLIQKARIPREELPRFPFGPLAKLFTGGLFIYPRVWTTFKLLPNILSAIQTNLSRLTESSWETDHVHVKSYPPNDPPEKFRKVRIYGQNKDAVLKARGAFQELVDGSLARNGDSILWDDFFSTFEGLKYLQQLYSTGETYIFRDHRRRCLILYGPDETKIEMQDKLIEKVKNLQNYSHFLKLNDEEFEAAKGGGLQEIHATFGKHNVQLKLAQKGLAINGTEQDVKTARKIIRSHLGLYDEEEESDQLCPSCYSEPEDPITTPCGHVYCQDCFIHQCGAENPPVPISCKGKEGTCNAVLSLDQLRDALPPSEYEGLLHNAFLFHIRRHPAKFGFCPTKDCPAIIRKKEQASDQPCFACQGTFCVRCALAGHQGLSCEAAADLAKTGGDLALQEYLDANGIPRCPSCKIPVVREDGCNQIQCASCGQNFCYHCGYWGTSFGDVHQHMLDEHGSYWTGVEHNAFQL